MNDLGVSFCSHNGEATFLEAARKLNAEQGFLRIDPAYLNHSLVWPADKESSPILGIKRTITMAPGLEEFLNSGRGGEFDGTAADYGVLAKWTLKEHLKLYWDASKPNLFLHSSGYDSRILSSILAELRDEGFDLGTIHFRCHDPEGPSFLKIMRRQGWAPNQYSVFVAPPIDAFDIGRWDRPGTSPWAQLVKGANFWSDLVPHGEERLWNLVSGVAGGEACEYPALGKAPFLSWRFCENKPVQLWFSYLVDNPDWIGDVDALFHKALFPYLGETYVRVIASLPTRFLQYEDNGCDVVRASILRTFKDPTLDIQRMPRVYDWKISPDRWADMRQRYDASVFHREVPDAPNADAVIGKMQADFLIDDSDLGRLWRLASLWDEIRA